MGISGGNSGSRKPDPSCTGSGPPGFDPGRFEELARRVEAANWADPALAKEVGEITKPFRVRPDWNPLAWLDEAMTLTGADWRLYMVDASIPNRFNVMLKGPPIPSVEDGQLRNLPQYESGVAPSFARAMTAAGLRALASAGRNPEGHDPVEGHGRNDEHAVAATGGETPATPSGADNGRG